MKRKEAPSISRTSSNANKRSKNEASSPRKVSPALQALETEPDSDPIVESDTTENSGDDNGVSWPSDNASEAQEWLADEEAGTKLSKGTSRDGPYILPQKLRKKSAAGKAGNATSSSRETHVKQKIIARERKAAKPHSELTAQTIKIWERLRIKSHLPPDERKKQVAALFEIITGRVEDLVFRHDSVRVIQTALKYANPEQRKMIARELEGSYRLLAEGKYAKFLIGKLLAHGDDEIRDKVLLELHGHVRRIIKHPEASWILDDIYRGIATPTQKARLLREWYGAEFAIFQTKELNSTSADLKDLLKRHPEKRTPIMRSLHELIDQLVQKRTTGFTMLHDAMLQYYLNMQPGSEEESKFQELLNGDEGADLLRNLTFTKSGARLVCLALSHGNARNRKHILKAFKDDMTSLMYDDHGHKILLTAFDVVDDTVLITKSIILELTGNALTFEDRTRHLLGSVNDRTARIALLYLFSGKSKGILPPEDLTLLDEIHQIRLQTSKKLPEVRRKELLASLSPHFLSLISYKTKDLVATTFGCQFISEVLFNASGDRSAASRAVAALARDEPSLLQTPAAGRLLKRLVMDGRFNVQTGRVDRVEPPLGFHDMLWVKIRHEIVDWASGDNSFVVLAMMEAEGFEGKEELKKILQQGRSLLEQAREEHPLEKKEGNPKHQAGTESRGRINPGTQKLLRLI